MKFLVIRVLNLNSLYGEHEVDLEQGLSGAAKFLITGPTGAGKSTLMDAVALALFGRTPRLGGGRGMDDEDPCHVMSRGAGEAAAALEFSRREGGERERDRVRYRAGWRVQRAWKKADEPFQAAIRTLQRQRDDGRWDTLVQSAKVKDFDPVFRRVLDGLTVEEFQRCVLLAQGQFAAFLRADEQERAAILERLTRTDRYLEIGKQANLARQQAELGLRSATAALGSIPLLPAEEVEALRREVGALATAVIECDQAVTNARAHRDWLARHGDLMTALGAAQVALTEAKRAEGNAAPDLARLAEHERCEPAAEVWRTWSAACEAERKARQRLPELQTAAAEASAAAAGAQPTEAALRQSWTLRQQELASALPHIANARALRQSHEQLKARRQRLARDQQAIADDVLASKALQDALAKLQADLVPLEGAADDAARRLRAQLAGAPDVATARASLRAIDKCNQDVARALDEAGRQLHERGGLQAQRAEEKTKADAAERDIGAETDRQGQWATERKHVADDRKRCQKDLDVWRWARDVGRQRDHLQPGAECPLCGGTDHPYVRDGRHAEADRHAAERVVELERRLADCEARDRELQAAEKKVAAALAGAQAQYRSAMASVQQLTDLERQVAQGLRDALKLAGLPDDADAGEVRAAVDRESAAREAHEATVQRLDEAEAAVRGADTALQGQREAVRERDQALARLQAAADARMTAWTAAQQEFDRARQELEARDAELPTELHDADLDARQRQLEAAVTSAQKAHASAEKQLKAAELTAAEARARLESGIQDAGQRAIEAKDASDLLAKKLQELDLADGDAFTARRLDTSRVAALAGQRAELQKRLAAATGACTHAETAQIAHTTQRPPDQPDADLAALEAALAAAETALATARTAHAENAAALRTCESDIARAGTLQREVDAARREHDVTLRLHRLIGRNDGQAFQLFAQTLNLAELAGKANHHLAGLAPRYTLVGALDSKGQRRLDFAVRDQCQAGQVRPLTTLSGGETFLVSLALALALADFGATRMPIETLLLDEGFGSLDPATLQTAMQALDALGQNQRVQIGLISHVEALKEQIQARVVVEPLGNGRSRVRVEA